MVLKVGHFNNINFKSSCYSSPVNNNFGSDEKNNKYNYVIPEQTLDYNVRSPQMYNKYDVVEIPNGLKIHCYKLANGHRVSIIPMKESPTTVKNYVNVGSLNETDDIKGISHFLEHMAFNGTLGSDGFIKLNQGDSFKKIEDLGGWINASTDFALTDYVNSTPLLEDKDLEEQIKILGSMTYDLALTEEMIEKEKGTVCSEINMILDSPLTIAYDQNVRTLFNIKSSADELIGGSVQHIKNLDREKVKSYYDTYYTPDNMNLVITGNVDPDKTIQIVSKYFNVVKARNGKVFEEKLSPIKNSIRKDFVTNKASSTTTVVGFAGPNSNDLKSKIILDIFSRYLESSEVGLIDGLSGLNTTGSLSVQNVSNNPNSPIFISYALFNSDNYSEKALRLLYEKLLNLKKPSDEYLEAIKKQCLNTYFNALEYSSNVNNLVGKNNILGNLDYLSNYENILKTITAEDVMEFANKFVNPQKAAITIVHPDVSKGYVIDNHKKANDINFKGKSRKPIEEEKIHSYVLDNNYSVYTYPSKRNKINLSIKYNCDFCAKVQ